MPKVIHKETGKEYTIANEDMAQAMESGLYEVVGPVNVNVGGDVFEADPGGVHDLASSAQEASAARETRLEREYGGVGDQIITGLEGAASGLTLGGYDLAARAIAGDEYIEDRRRRAEINPGANIAGEIVGSVAPTLLTGGAGTAARLARSSLPALVERGAARVGAKAGGGILGAGVRFGTEGAIFGAGEGVRELALSEDPITLERAVGTLSSNALLGGGLGVGLGVAGKLAEKGIASARQMTTKAIAKRASSSPQGMKVVDDIRSYHESRGPAFLLAKGDEKAVLSKQARRIRDNLDAPESLAKSPRRLDMALEKEQNALRKIMEEGPEATLERLRANDARVADAVREKLASLSDDAVKVSLPKKLASEYRDAMGMAGRGKLTVKVEDAKGFIRKLEAGELDAMRREALERLPEIYAANQAARESIEAAAATKGRTLLDDAAGAAKTYAAGAALGMVPGGPLGAVAGFLAPKAIDKLGELVTGALAKAGDDVATKLQRATDALFDAADSGLKSSLPKANKVLATVRFGANSDDGKEPRSLPKRFEARRKELMAHVESGPDGKPKMRMQSRRELAKTLGGVAAVDALLADRIESHMARRVEYLAAKIPKRPRLAGPLWRPSESQIRSFARTVAAVEDPVGVMERAADGIVSREDIDALREVYPGIYNHTRAEVLARLPELRESLPYRKRLALSMLLGVPVDASMDPEIFVELQATYSTEPGTQGGTQGPTPKPQFGSISKPNPTPAQERAG